MFNRNALFMLITCDPVYLIVMAAVYFMCQGPVKSLTHYIDTISLLESEYSFMCNEIFSPLVWNIKSFLLFFQLDICSPPTVLLINSQEKNLWKSELLDYLCDYTFCSKKMLSRPPGCYKNPVFQKQGCILNPIFGRHSNPSVVWAGLDSFYKYELILDILLLK